MNSEVLFMNVGKIYQIIILDASELLNKVLEENSYTQKQLAEILGVTKGYVSRLLSGSENLSVKNVAMALHALGYRYSQGIERLSDSKLSQGDSNEGK